jgi:hypothetical protein
MLISIVSILNTVNQGDTLSSSDREWNLDQEVGVNMDGKPMTCKDWTDEWWTWLLKIDEDHNPYTLTSPHLNTYERMRAGQPNKVQSNSWDKTRGENKHSVWFLAYSPYGSPGEGQMARVKVPPGFSILASPYNAVASPQFYPGKDISGCCELLDEDLNGVYEIYATLDGIRLVGCTVKQDKAVRLTLPPKNVFDGPPGDHEAVHYGHWAFLKPLPLGDHWLHLHGNSRNYQLDITLHLMVQNPIPTPPPNSKI